MRTLIGACLCLLLALFVGVGAATAKTVTYYVAADEVDWDYAPAGYNLITGEPFDDEANVFVQNGPDRIGRVYTKALYREYTDDTFTTLKRRGPGRDPGIPLRFSGCITRIPTNRRTRTSA